MLLALIIFGCSSIEKEEKKNTLHFDDSNYRRELKFSVNGQEIDGYGTAKKSPFGYTVEAKVSDEIFRGFVRSCNGTKKLEIQEQGTFKKKKYFKTFIPVLGEPFDISCLIEIFLFSGNGVHLFGVFDTIGEEKLRFQSSCNYDNGPKVGSDFCHSSVGDYYFLDFKGKKVKFFFDENLCPEPEALDENGKYQIRIVKTPCIYLIAHKLFKQRARITIMGWNDIFLREIF